MQTSLRRAMVSVQFWRLIII